jgi:two-component system, chemotaxis family, chemotaxis protein CheY
MQSDPKNADALIKDAKILDTKVFDAKILAAKVLIVDDDYYTRKVIRTLLAVVGIVNVHDATDGESGLEAIQTLRPDIVILDWEMPGINGAGFTRRVRSPATFSYPGVPIIMLTGHSERSRVAEAVGLGVHEYLLKPVSSAALRDTIVSVLANPRPMVRRGDYYGPEPRPLATYKPGADSYNLRAEQAADRSLAFRPHV